jgi:hypothetical protein
MASAIDLSINNIWPVNGATLKEARRLIMGEDFCVHIQQSRDALLTVPQMSFGTKLAAFDVLHWSFLEQLRLGPYPVVGRRGWPTSPDSPIPPSAWAYLRVHDWRLSRVFEPDGTIWYDIRVWSEDQIGTTNKTVGAPAAQRKLTTVRWIEKQVERRRTGEIPIAKNKSQFAKELCKEMVKAQAAGVVDKAVRKRTLENVLRIKKLWPIEKPRK